LRKQIPLMDPRTPRLRLSRPGSSAVRVIPPLRGLERVFCCSWCQHNLFNLASVIRTDLNVLPLPDLLNMDAGEKRDSYAGDNICSSSSRPGYAGFKDPNTFLMPAPSPRGFSSNGHATSFAADAKGGGGYVYRDPPKTMRGGGGGGAKGFSFDDSPVATPTALESSSKAFDFNVSSYDSRGCKGAEESPTSSGDVQDDMLDSDDQPPPAQSSGSTQKSRFHLDMVQTFDDGNSSSGSSRSRPPSGSSSSGVPRMIFPPRLGSGGPPVNSPLESPRIPFPEKGARESFTYPSPRDRPPSAEKMRWLARVNLLRSDIPGSETYCDPDSEPHSQSKSELKVAKLSNDDDEAIKLGFGRDKYIHLEYLEWMGEDLLSQSIDEGELKCGFCRRVIGSWTWTPTER
jgi:hypothetical protein